MLQWHSLPQRIDGQARPASKSIRILSFKLLRPVFFLADNILYLTFVYNIQTFVSFADIVTVESIIKKLKNSIEGDVLDIVVQRRRIIRSAQIAISEFNFSFFRPISIHFSGEDARDDGGPTREFFRFVNWGDVKFDESKRF